MIRVQFVRHDTIIRGFVSKGHAHYAEHGEDIVCAAVAALTQVAVVGLTEVIEIEVILEIKAGYLACMLPDDLSAEQLAQSQIILNTLYKGLLAIRLDYGDFLKVEEV